MKIINSKIIWILLIVLSMLSVDVYAKDNCNMNDIKIMSIKSDFIDGVSELSNPTQEDNIIKLNLQMRNVGDNIIYETVIKNVSDKDYYLNDTSIQLNSNYFDCRIVSDDKLTIIKPGQETKVKFRISYRKEVEESRFRDNKYEDDQVIVLKLEDQNNSNKLLLNPLTNNNLIKSLITLIFIIGVTIYIVKNKKIKYLSLIVVILIPISINALCKVELNINTHIVINKESSCSYDGKLEPGVEFKKGNFTYHYMEEYHYSEPILPEASNPVLVNSTIKDGFYDMAGWIIMPIDGWGVRYTPSVENTIENNTMCAEINNKPIVSMTYLFSNIDVDEETKLDLIDTSNVINMEGMFSFTNATPSNLSNFNTSNVKNMSNMFYRNTSFSLDLGSFDTRNVEDMSNMFGRSNATTLDLSNFNTSNVEDMSSMFSKNHATTLDLSSFDTSNVKDMSEMFYYSDAKSINLSSFDTSNVENMRGMFYDTNTRTLDLSSFNTSKVTNMGHMFVDSLVTNLDLSNFNTSKVTNMSHMFRNCSAKSINLSSFNTSNVEDMSSMFSRSEATTLDLSSFDTSKVTSMEYMFSDSIATTLDLSSFDTSKVTDMGYMFSGSKATTLDLSSFDTSKVTDMGYMFSDSKATILDLSSFDTSNVVSIFKMFYECSSTTGYARTQADADKFNSSDTSRPSYLTFVLK